MLSENATAGMARTARSILALSERARLPLALTEINSVTCGGTPGVSDTFATALWAPDALFELLRAGVESVNVHVRPETINLAFALDKQGLVARALGPNAQLVPLRQNSQRSDHLKAWAARVKGDVLHVLLINKGQKLLQVGLHLPASGLATVQRLRAPSASSRSNVQLDGQHLNQQGHWQGRSVRETLRSGANGYRQPSPDLAQRS